MPMILVLIGCGDRASLKTLGVDDVEISGVYLGMSEEEVTAHLGEPHTREVTPEFTGYNYRGLTVAFRSGGLQIDSPRVVDSIYTTSSDYCLLSDICPSDTLAEIRKTLGPAESETATNDEPKRLFYPLPELEACWLWILTEDKETASEISLVCEP